ncbi:tetratricopeptide repeat protein [Streptomyces sp. NBC_00138]
MLAGRRMLVLLDNAATAAQVRPLLPGTGDSLVVVTSRSRLTGLAIRDGARRLTLGTLPEPEAVALLRAVTAGYRPEDDQDKLTELARLCARLPLALRIAAERAATHPHLRLDDLITDLRDESALWDTLSTGDDEEADAVRTVFTWSYRALPAPTARLFRLLGLHPGPDFSLHAASALTGHSPTRTRQLLDNLTGAHLLEQTAPDRYQFHDLLRAYATDQAHHDEPPDQREAALRRALHWYLHTADAAQTWIRPAEEHLPLPDPGPDTRPLTFTDYDTAVDWTEREHTNALHAVRAAAAAGLDHLTWQLATVLWNALPPSAPVTDWIDSGLTGLEAAERAGEQSAQLLLLTFLGMGYRGANRHDDALDCLNRALEISRASGNRLEEAHALNLIGLTHLRTRQLDDATHDFVEALDLFRQLGSAHWAATALTNLAGAHLSAGHLTEAAAVIQQALAAHRSLHDRSGEGEILFLAAELHREQAEIEEALRCAHEALDIALALRNHRLEGFWLITLGNAQQAAGQYGDALTSYQRSAMLHRRLGDHSREALAWRGTGQTYLHLNRAQEAADFHRQAATAHHHLGDTWQHALELDCLATALHPTDPTTAHHHWTQALTHLTEYDDPRATQTRDRIARRLAANGD